MMDVLSLQDFQDGMWVVKSYQNTCSERYPLQDELKKLYEEEHKKLDEQKTTGEEEQKVTEEDASKPAEIDDSTPPKKDGTD